MLHRSLREQSIGALLGGHSMAEVLASYLNTMTSEPKPSPVAPKSLQANCRKAIRKDLEVRDSTRRQNELEAAALKLCTDTFLSAPDLPQLQAIVDELLDTSTDPTSFRAIYVQTFACLAAEVDPVVLVAWHLAGKCLRGSHVEHTALRESINAQVPLSVPMAPFDLQMAENHAHLWGSLSSDHVLVQFILDPEIDSLSQAFNAKTNPEDRALQLRLLRIRNMLKAFVTLWSSRSGDGALQTDESQHLLAKASDQHLLEALNTTSLDWRNELELLGDIKSHQISARSILRELAATIISGGLQQAWLWLFVALWRTYRNKAATATVRAAVLLVVCELMLLRRRLIMEGRGLRRFSTRYYNIGMQTYARKSAKWASSVYKDLSTRLFAHREDLAELKISTSSFTANLTAAFAQAVSGQEAIAATSGLIPPAQNATTAARRELLRDSLERWHFCAHFNRSGNGSIASRRKELWKEAGAMANSLAQQSGWRLSDFLGGADTSDLMFHPAHFIRGLDVAGDETRWPIEVFAPVLRWLRNPEVRQRLVAPTAPHPGPLHFSIHAGEDYAHPLSGMRHVDETVWFCDMRENDRLGHALALGLLPDDWSKRHGEMLLSVDEHLDNLVWAWQVASPLAPKLPVLERFCSRLEARINRFLPHVSWCRPINSPLLPSSIVALESQAARMPSKDVLCEAWMLRKNCPVTFNAYDSVGPTIEEKRLRAALPDFERLLRARKSPGTDPAAELYFNRAKAELFRPAGPQVMVQLTPQPDGKPTRRQRQLETQEPDASGQLHDHDDENDHLAMVALQDYLLETYAARGLSIEANPTSNVYISGMETHCEHPIFRWNPPDAADLGYKKIHNRFGLRTQPIPVTVNTDDQGLLPTTMRMEYHLIREAALDRYPDEQQVDAWIEAVRQLGISHFKRNHLSVIE